MQGTVDVTLPAQEAQTGRVVAAMSDLCDPGVAEVGTGELDAGDLADFEVASADQHPSNRQVEHATGPGWGGYRAQARLQIPCIGDSTMPASVGHWLIFDAADVA